LSDDGLISPELLRSLCEPAQTCDGAKANADELDFVRRQCSILADMLFSSGRNSNGYKMCDFLAGKHCIEKDNVFHHKHRPSAPIGYMARLKAEVLM
jgi:hypothetical protein